MTRTIVHLYLLIQVDTFLQCVSIFRHDTSKQTRLMPGQCHKFLLCLGQETGNTTIFDPDQLSFTSLHVVGRRINSGYRRNFKVQVGDSNYKKISHGRLVEVLWGVSDPILLLVFLCHTTRPILHS